VRSGSHTACGDNYDDYDDSAASDNYSTSDNNHYNNAAGNNDSAASDNYSTSDNNHYNNAAGNNDTAGYEHTSGSYDGSATPADCNLSAERLRRSGLADWLLLRRRLSERRGRALRSDSCPDDDDADDSGEEAEQQCGALRRSRCGRDHCAVPRRKGGIVNLRWLGAPICPQDAVCAVGYWDGTKCAVQNATIKVCAPLFQRNPATGCCEAVGRVRLENRHFYRGRFLVGYDPAKTKCEDIATYLNAAFANAESNPGWPWKSLKVFLAPFQTWPSTRTGMPYSTTNYCLVYMQGQWVQSAADRTALDMAALIAPSARPVDFWDDTADPLAQKLLYDLSLPGWGCDPGRSLTYDTATGESKCVGVPGAQPIPGTTITTPTSAKKSSNAPLYAALGALAIGAVYVVSKGIS